MARRPLFVQTALSGAVWRPEGSKNRLSRAFFFLYFIFLYKKNF
jgi:hypothetical protein